MSEKISLDSSGQEKENINHRGAGISFITYENV